MKALRVHWLPAPDFVARETAPQLAARAARAGAAWMADAARGETVIACGRALCAGEAAARGLHALAEAMAQVEFDVRVAAGATQGDGNFGAQAGALWLGINPFDAARAAGGVWGEKPPAVWFVPRVALVQNRGRGFCAVAGAPNQSAALQLRDQAAAQLQKANAAPAVSQFQNNAAADESAESFCRRVEIARAAISEGALQKVVLARAKTVSGAAPINAAEFSAALFAAEPEAVHFGFPMACGVFAGATPERLLRATGDAVYADALAGSAARQSCPAQDSAAKRALQTNPKEREEHARTRDAVAAALAPHCAGLQAPEAPCVLSTAGLHHLHTPFAARRKSGVSLLALAARLAPTPAVAGAPAAAALEWLRRHEPLARGAYAGPFGWMNAQGQGALAVALRCALLCGNAAHAFAGAGVVAASEPRAEYAETRLKMRGVLAALQSAGARA